MQMLGKVSKCWKKLEKNGKLWLKLVYGCKCREKLANFGKSGQMSGKDVQMLGKMAKWWGKMCKCRRKWQTSVKDVQMWRKKLANVGKSGQMLGKDVQMLGKDVQMSGKLGKRWGKMCKCGEKL